MGERKTLITGAYYHFKARGNFGSAVFKVLGTKGEKLHVHVLWDADGDYDETITHDSPMAERSVEITEAEAAAIVLMRDDKWLEK